MQRRLTDTLETPEFSSYDVNIQEICTPHDLIKISEHKSKFISDMFQDSNARSNITNRDGMTLPVDPGTLLAKTTPTEKQMMAHELTKSADYDGLVIQMKLKVYIAKYGDNVHKICSLYIEKGKSVTDLKWEICKACSIPEKMYMIIWSECVDKGGPGEIVNPD